MNKLCFEALDRTLRDILNCHLLLDLREWLF